MSLTRPVLAALAVAAALTLTACGSGAATGTADAQPSDGTWTLVTGTGPQGPLVRVDGYPVTVTVTGGTIRGVAACNSFGGTLRRDGDGFVTGDLAVTEMACADQRATALEAAFLDALGRVRTAAVDRTTLTLTGDGVSLALARNAPDPQTPLTGTRWTVDSLVTGDSVSSVQGAWWLRLDDGRLTGGWPCAEATGRYTLDGTALLVTDLEVVHAAAADCTAEVARAEEHLTAVLSGRVTATVVGRRLTLAAGDRGLGLVKVLE